MSVALQSAFYEEPNIHDTESPETQRKSSWLAFIKFKQFKVSNLNFQIVSLPFTTTASDKINFS